MVDDLTAYLCIAAMMLVTYATRLGGPFVMNRVTVTPRLDAFLRQLTASVLIAIVVPAAWSGGSAAWLAVAAAGGAMIVSRNTLAAMTAGVAAAAGFRLLM